MSRDFHPYVYYVLCLCLSCPIFVYILSYVLACTVLCLFLSCPMFLCMMSHVCVHTAYCPMFVFYPFLCLLLSGPMFILILSYISVYIVLCLCRSCPMFVFTLSYVEDNRNLSSKCKARYLRGVYYLQVLYLRLTSPLFFILFIFQHFRYIS